MYDYIVPQELNIADRIGAFTLGQWAFIATGILSCMFLLISESIPFVVAILLAGPIMGLSTYLAFFKRYGMPVYEFIFVYLLFKTKPKEMLYSSESKIDFDYEDDEELGDFVLG